MKLNKLDPGVNIDQQKAIYTKNKNILVSAPAGSGKTKILVNRMMEHLLHDNYSVDDFLVVTFTAAAALEMKQRLSKEIDKYEELKEEKVKLPYAYITNFHGFCSTLLKKYGSLVNVPPAFEILEDPTVLKNEAYTICLERWLEDEQFKDFVSLYFPGSDLSKFFSQLMNLVESMHVIENKDTYLDEVIKEKYDTCDSDEWPVIALLQEYLVEMLEVSKINLDMLCKQALKMGLDDFFERPAEQSPAASKKYVPMDAYNEWVETLDKTLSAPFISYETLMTQCAFKLPASYPMNWKDSNYPDKDNPERKRFDALKKKIVAPFKKACDEFYTEDNTELLMRSKSYLYLFLGKGGLVEQFNQVYSTLKLTRNYLDFNDLEDYTIKLLDPHLPIASLLQSRLKEVMIDEYQDTNGIQEKIVRLITEGTSINKFMVGDIKQAIYRFRRADPAIFNEKYESYEVFEDELPEGMDVRIDLHYNYRSNKIVLDSINYIFNMLMDTKIGDVRYLQDTNHQLNYDFYRKKDEKDKYDHEIRFNSELLLYDQEGESDLSEDELEATLVAMRILELVRNETIDTFEKTPRAINFKDIAVLTRTTSSLVTFKKIFHRFGIPSLIVLSNGYYQSVEVQAILTLINSLMNPLDDLNMVSILRGNFAFSHFSDQEIYDLKMKYKEEKICLYEAMKKEEKYQAFLENYHYLQNHLSSKPADLLEMIYAVTKYPIFVSQLFNGEQRKANLDLLMDYMLSHNGMTIYEIIHDLNLKIELGTDSSPATVLDEHDNMVQFMTIHKSKGLEFPIVFVCNMDHGMNKQDIRQSVIIDGKNGIALKPRGYEKIEDYSIMCEYMNPYHKLLSRLVGKQSVSEEMRILYVALTRASQKLIMTGGCDIDYMKKVKEEAIFMNDFKGKNYILPYNMRNKKCYLDWVIFAYFVHPAIINSFHYGDFNLKGIVSKVNYLSNENIRNTKLTMKMYSKEGLLEKAKDYTIMHTKKEKKAYPITLMKEIERKEATIAVTSLIDEVPYERVYTNKRKLTATEFGSLAHQFFEYFPLEKNDVIEVIDYYHHLGLWNDLEESELKNYSRQLQGFIDSDVFTMMKNTKQLMREKEFSLRVEDGTIIHGTFDVLCINDQDITIIDYKTDRVSPSSTQEELEKIHAPQMSYYKQLIRTMYPETQVKAIVYYLEIGRYVTL